MSGKDKLRQIKPIKITDILPASVGTDEKPVFEWVDPCDLYIEEKYQRNLSERSITLIRKIYKDFQWSRMKPPVCSYGDGNKLFVIDGQHTAVAAASHPNIKTIPVMIVDAHSMRERAASFMGHNRDRVAVTPAQMFYSSVAAEDPIALAVRQALDDTGAAIVRYNPPIWKIGQTMAVGNLLKIAERKGVPGLTRVLNILMEAKRAPIHTVEVSATADLIWGKEWAGKFDDYDLSTVIRSYAPEQWRAKAEAQIRKGQAIPMKRALAILWYKHVPKKRTKGAIPIKTL